MNGPPLLLALLHMTSTKIATFWGTRYANAFAKNSIAKDLNLDPDVPASFILGAWLGAQRTHPDQTCNQ